MAQEERKLLYQRYFYQHKADGQAYEIIRATFQLVPFKHRPEYKKSRQKNAGQQEQ